MTKPKLIDNREKLKRFIDAVSGQPHIAVDSETNSFFAYRPRICLIQISCDEGDFILDPLALQDLSSLGLLFADPAVEKILHAAENDLLGLRRDFHFHLRNIFDTAVASRLLGRKRLALAKILSEEFGVELDKRFQRCNWEKRPLSPEQLYYAQLDTRFLIQLRHRLHRMLLERNLWSLAQERFARLERIRHKRHRGWNPEGYLYLKGYQELPPSSQKVLKELFAYRERLARNADKAPFRIMTNDCLVRLARKMPENRLDLRRFRGLPSRFKGKGAEQLLQVIRRSKLNTRL